tara:strand:+ start:174 stop:1553 length:1380 start_codon:yes stop_codon:yes gene_type:complete
MYKTLTISSVVMILAFSGYISEVPSSKVSISIEIDFPQENIDKKTNVRNPEVEVLEKEKIDVKEEVKTIAVIERLNEEVLIANHVKSYKSNIDLLVENDKKYGLLEETKYLLDRYFDLLKKKEEEKLQKQRVEKQKLFWQHDKYIEYENGIRGIYLNGYLYGNESFKEKMHDLVFSTEINAVVIDIKSDNGHVLYETKVQEAININSIRVKYSETDLSFYKNKDIYLIGRLVAFQDPLFAKKHPESAVWDKKNDTLYKQGKQYFLDPSDLRARKYILDLAVDACRIGFNEIQLDYIRYPDSQYKYMEFDLESTVENRTFSIQSFLYNVQQELHSEGCLLSADIFGYVLTNRADGGIGQNLESIITSVDFISPMVYPSHYSRGSFGYESPNNHPFEIVTSALEDGIERIDDKRQLRPYLQSFWHTDEEIREGIRAAEDKNLSWILWNSISNYSYESLMGD